MATFDYSPYTIDKNINPLTGGQNIYKNGVVQDYVTMQPLFKAGFDVNKLQTYTPTSTPTTPQTTTPAQNTATGQNGASGGYLAVPHDTNPGAYKDIYNPQGQMINQQQFQQLGLDASQIPVGSMQDVQKLQLGASGLSPDQQSKIAEAQNLWNVFNQQTPEQKTQQAALQTSLDKLIALQTQLSKVNAPSDQMAALDKTIQDQQKALNSLNPADYFNTQAGLKDVGITQDQLQRQLAVQRDPIARGLSDLLNSRSILGQQQQAQQQNIQNQIQGQQNIFQLQKAMGDLTPSNKLPSSALDTLFSSIFNPKQAPQPTASIQEYEYAVKNGYKGSFTQYQNEDANRKMASGGGSIVTHTDENGNLIGVDKTTGKVVWTVSGGGKNKLFTPQKISAMNAGGLSEEDATNIYSAILNGHSLEDIRSALRQDGKDPQLLDVFDKVNNIAKVTGSLNQKVKSEMTFQ